MRTALIMILLALPGSASAALCGPTETLLATIRETYQEVPQYIAVQGGAVVTFTVSPSGSWSVLMQTQSDVICLVLSGDGWGDAPAAMKAAHKPEKKL